MAKEMKTRDVVRLLKAAKWTPARAFTGSHHVWIGPNGTRFSLTEGHKVISAGVVAKLLKAIKEDEDK